MRKIRIIVSNEKQREAGDAERREPRVCHQSASYFHFNIVSVVRELHISEISEFILINTRISTDISSSLPICEVIRLSPSHITQFNESVALIKNRA